MRYPEYVAKVINKLEENRFEAYIVGGSVRDMLLGKEPNDYDVTTSARPEKTLEIFSDMRTIPTGLKHGTVTVMSDGNPIEVTTFRVDGEYLDSRRPESVSFTSSISDDLSRRDFTVNAMAYSEKRGVIDLFGGREDLERQIIRAVGDPKKRFSEDALRIMRAFRFSSQLGFDIDKATLDGACEMREGLAKIAAERIAAEFIRTICTNTPHTSLELMAEKGIFEFITGGYIPKPEVLSALERSPRLAHIRLGIFLSDAEKEQARQILRGLKLSNKLVSDSLRISAGVSEQLAGTDADARRFIGKHGELSPDILDAASALGRLDEDFLERVNKAISEKSCATGGSLALNGGDLVKLGAKGREVGELLSYLLERVIEEPELNEKQALLAIARKHLDKS